VIETVCDLIRHPIILHSVFLLWRRVACVLSSHNFHLGQRFHGPIVLATMLQQAQMRLTQYKDRFHSVQFDLALDWRHPSYPVQAALLPSNPSFDAIKATTLFTTFTSVSGVHQ